MAASSPFRLGSASFTPVMMNSKAFHFFSGPSLLFETEIGKPVLSLQLWARAPTNPHKLSLRGPGRAGSHRSAADRTIVLNVRNSSDNRQTRRFSQTLLAGFERTCTA